MVHRLGERTKEEKSFCWCLKVPTLETRNGRKQKMVVVVAVVVAVAVVHQQVAQEAALAFIVTLNNKSIETNSLTQPVVDRKS